MHYKYQHLMFKVPVSGFRMHTADGFHSSRVEIRVGNDEIKSSQQHFAGYICFFLIIGLLVNTFLILGGKVCGITDNPHNEPSFSRSCKGERTQVKTLKQKIFF